ncbi:MAG: hypothetical protein JO305_09635 [Alphaproteobacteria bacterium]|nr:hypothetical protein [Alphaproteobacteria bacterium]
MFTVAGCSIIGPTEISTSRSIYNRVIQETSKQQMFMNIVRVSEHEPTLFMDVTEVDAAMYLQAALGGSKTGIGAHSGLTGGTLAGAVGAITGSLAVQESPTIRYQPLQGQPLVQQIQSPISADTIGKLYDSDWPIGVILALAVDRISQSFLDSPAIIDAIEALDDYGVIGLVAARSVAQASTDAAADPLKPTRKGSAKPVRAPAPPAGGKQVGTDLGTLTIQTKSGSGGDEKESDTLAIYLRPSHPELLGGETVHSEMTQIDQLWERLRSVFKESAGSQVGIARTNTGESSASEPDIITIRTIPAPLRVSPGRNLGGTGGKAVGATTQKTIEEPPAMRTHSAIGILKDAFLPPASIEIVSRARFEAITDCKNAPWNCFDDESPKNRQLECAGSGWYTLLPRICARPDESSSSCPSPVPENTTWENDKDTPAPDAQGLIYLSSQTVYSLITRDSRVSDRTKVPHPLFCLYTTSLFNDIKNQYGYQSVLNESRLFNLRRYILIIKEPHCPGNAYVSYEDNDSCYYIDNKDKISKTNFILVSLFLTMQAVPPTTAPLTPTISVGGQGG